MRFFLGLLATVFLLAGVGLAEAAPRLLPAAPGYGATLNASPAAQSGLNRLRMMAASAGQVRVIVSLRAAYAAEAGLSRSDVRQQRHDIAGARRAVMKRLPSTSAGNLRSFDTLPILAVNVTAADIDHLAAEPFAFSIEEDRLNKLQLAESVPLIRGNEAWSAGYTGLGQTVAIIDSGVDKSHPFLFGKVVSEACYSAGGWCPSHTTSSTAPGSAIPCPASDCIHGTHVAGIAAGLGTSFSGVAKNASIIAIQVMSPAGGGTSAAYDSDIIAGLNRVLALKDSFRIAAVNMSLGSETVYSQSCDSVGNNAAMKRAIDNLKAAGIATIISSGNSYATAGISSPSCISSAISVGSVSDSAWGTCNGSAAAVDKVACYSNSSDGLKLLAPGSLITSSIPGRRYASLHGTSMAAPHVTGAWAVLKEKSPGASVDQVLAALTTSGKPITDYRNGIVKPRIDVKAAADALSDSRVPLTLTNAGPLKGTVNFSPAGTLASCPGDCINRYAVGTRVTLTAKPGPGQSFFGWGGACSGSGSCVVTMSAERSVSAIFVNGPLQTLSYVAAGTGSGTTAFSAADISATCTASCNKTFWQDALVTLVAQPADGSVFTGWTGGCIGQKTSCAIRMSSAKTVTATYSRLAQTAVSYSKTGSGSGTVIFGTAGSCTGTCTVNVNAGTGLLVTAVADPGSIFAGWTGACQGPKQLCYVTVNSPIALTANFLPSTLAARP